MRHHLLAGSLALVGLGGLCFVTGCASGQAAPSAVAARAAARDRASQSAASAGWPRIPAVCRPSWACQCPMPARLVILEKRQLSASDV
jgi:hypothetical protein